MLSHSVHIETKQCVMRGFFAPLYAYDYNFTINFYRDILLQYGNVCYTYYIVRDLYFIQDANKTNLAQGGQL